MGLIGMLDIGVVVVASRRFGREECDKPDFLQGPDGGRRAWVMMAGGWSAVIAGGLLQFT